MRASGLPCIRLCAFVIVTLASAPAVFAQTAPPAATPADLTPLGPLLTGAGGGRSGTRRTYVLAQMSGCSSFGPQRRKWGT